MRSSFIDRILRRNTKIKEQAKINKQKVAESASKTKKEQVKETITEPVEVMKEPKTLPLD